MRVTLSTRVVRLIGAWYLIWNGLLDNRKPPFTLCFQVVVYHGTHTRVGPHVLGTLHGYYVKIHI